MNKLADYQVQKTLYQSQNTVVFSGLCIETQQPVVIKAATSGPAALSRNKRLRREYQLGNSFKSPYVVEYYQLISSSMGLALVMENVDGHSLLDIIDEDGMPLEKFLPLALEMAQGLADIHRQGIVHKDIKPSNVLVYEEKKIKFIDFGISSKLSLEYQQRVPGRLEGTLPYISPEQTGRMNRPLDYRTDFYSLGATFYHMLTGKAPFQSEDSLEMIHSHLARPHVPVNAVRRDIPEVISEMVKKLMAKSAESRYQSGDGIAKDLRRCLGQWQLVGKISPFAPGQEDISEKFTIPNQLYGRAQEMHTLMTTFRKVMHGSREMILVTGEAGVGKSSLALEMEPLLIEQKGFFAVGKFESYSRDTPYSAIANAFGQLISMLLGEDNRVIERWRIMLTQSLGSSAAAVARVVPNLDIILGKSQEDRVNLPSDNRNRFHHAIGQLVSCFASPKHPFLLFLDNLQWADMASLELLEALMVNSMIKGLFIIGTAREEDDTNPLLGLSLESLKNQGLNVPALRLGNLDVLQLKELVLDTLHCSPDQAATLADILVKKTRGNPFFTVELLMKFNTEGLIHFDHVHQCWRWDEGAIRAASMPDTLAELVVDRLHTLPKETCRILCYAACIGSEFSHQLLAHVAQFSIAEITQLLQPSLEQNLVIPLRSIYPMETDNLEEDLKFRFQHHRVWKAAHQLVSPLERAHIHLVIGRHLRDKQDPGSEAEVIHHLNDARALLDDDEERMNLATLNLIAAQKALDTMAYHTANKYLEIGIQCLPLEPWKTCYRLCFDLHMRFAEASYLKGDYERARATWEATALRAENILDKVAVFELKMVHCMTVSKFDEAVETGLMALDMLDIKQSRFPTRKSLISKFTILHLRLMRTSLEKQAERPDIHEPRLRAVLNILMRLNLATYFTGERYLYAYSAIERVSLSLKYGNSPESANAFVTFGMLLSMRGDYNKALKFGQLALKLDERYRCQPLRCKVLFIYAFCIHSWHHHWRDMTPYLKEAIEAGLQTGDQLYGTLACMMISLWQLCHNVRLSHETGTHYLNMLESSGFTGRTGIAELLSRFRLCLMGETAGLTSLTGEDFDEQQCLEAVQSSNFRSGMALYHLIRVQLAYLYEDQTECLMHLHILQKHENALSGTPLSALTTFFGFLALCRWTRKENWTKEHGKRLQGMLKQMRNWAKLCPNNFSHLADLMAAELSGKERATWKTATLYRQAVDGARKNQYIMFQAIAAEAAYHYFQDQDQITIATAYLREADAAYQQWGATAKVMHMREHSPNQLLDRTRLPLSHKTSSSTTISTTTDEYSSAMGRSLKKVIQMNSELSSEMDYQRLSRKILDAAAATTKAYGVALIDNHQSRLMVNALTIMDDQTFLEIQPLEHCKHICQRAVRQTVAREHTLLLPNARITHPYSQDSYVVTQGIQSLLCVPIRYKDQVSGALYLESRNTNATFNDQDVAWLSMLAGPAAISLENARLYTQTRQDSQEVRNLNRDLARLNEDLENRVRERTAELEEVQRKLVEKAHHEGMNQIATSVLHNVGSILTSVITSCQTIQTTIESSRMPGLFKANEMLRENMDRVETFLSEDPKGADLMRYYLGLDKPFLKEKETIEENISRLIDKVERIRVVILAQQSYARAGFQRSELYIGDAVNDALSILSGELARANVNVVRLFHTKQTLELPKNKLIHLSVNLIRNAMESLEEVSVEGRSLEILLEETEGGQALHFKDTGKGIHPDHLEHIFEHGFTTRSNAQGFGLHAAANAMTEMGGSIEVHSDGPGKGATFVLSFPSEPPQDLARNENS